MAKVEVIIDPKQGTTKYAIEGVVGEACNDLTKALREDNEELEYQQTSEFCEEQEQPDYVEEMG